MHYIPTALGLIKARNQRGFTLIELSVVLVIIGLIVGGVLVGKDLIKSAQNRSLIAQVEQFKSAANTFKVKYNCLPGDCGNATTFLGTDSGGCPTGGGATGTCNGNEDGGVGLTNAAIFCSFKEYLLFWQHLGLADLIPGKYSVTAVSGRYAEDRNFPSSKVGGAFGVAYFGVRNEAPNTVNIDSSGMVFPGNYGNIFMIGKPWGDVSSILPISPVLSAKESFNIDKKFDDGLPATGTIRTWQYSSGYSTGCATTNDPLTALYASSDTVSCSLFFISAF